MLATLVLGFAIPPTVNLSHFRLLLSRSLSRSLDRQASVEDVRLRLLPLPGFTFRHLRISDDDEFGGEPILQTQEDAGQNSFATLRLTSLWRCRLEIASVSLTQASLNLVRASDGHWNLERLINRAAQVPSAPTSKKKPEFRARFPYIELKDSRINFKFGPEKKPFALSEAEFALWLAAENRWNVRLKAVPLRTDESISDTSVIRLSGSFDRASQFAQTPFHFQASWDRPEVNAMLRIARGYDPGWRGVVDLNAELKGTPADFSAHIEGSIDEFRRYDISRTSSLDLRVSCDQRFRADEDGAVGHQLDFKCRLPLDPGAITATGKLQFGNSPAFSARIFAGEVPVASFVQAMLHAKSSLPGDLTGDGTVDGDWSIERTGSNAVKWQGAISARDVSLHSRFLEPALVFPHVVRVNFEAPQTSNVKKTRAKITESSVARAEIEPFMLDLGGDAQVSASFDTQGYQMSVRGPVDWQRLLQAAIAIGLRPPPNDLQGSGTINARYAGEWHHFGAPTVSGEAQIDNAKLSLRGFSEPLTVSAGVLNFDGASFQASKIAGAFAHSGIEFVGSFSGTRQCEKHVICNVNFSIETPELRERAVLELLKARSGLPLPFFSSGHEFEAKWLLEIPSSGSITANRLAVGNLRAEKASALVEVGNAQVSLHHWVAALFDGQHEGDWTFDFSGPEPRVQGAGTLRHAQMEQARAAFDDRTGMGIFDLDYRIAMRGDRPDQLRSSASGSGNFTWSNGTFAKTYPPAESTTIHFGNWSGRFTIEKERVTVLDSRMDSSSGLQEVSGEILFNRQWNLRFVRANATGVVASGRVANSMAPNPSSNTTEARR